MLRSSRNVLDLHTERIVDRVHYGTRRCHRTGFSNPLGAVRPPPGTGLQKLDLDVARDIEAGRNAVVVESLGIPEKLQKKRAEEVEALQLLDLAPSWATSALGERLRPRAGRDRPTR